MAACIAGVSTGSAEAASKTSPLIVTPRHGALVTAKSVRVVIRRRAHSRTRVRIGRRDVTARFRVRGGRLVARLSRRNGLRPGRNHLIVVSRVKGRRELRHSRSFYLLQRRRGMLRVRLGRGHPPRLRIAIVSGAKAVTLRRRPRTVRVWLNGRSVTRSLTAPHGALRKISLSASHGLRYGVNRLRVSVVEPKAGRYAVVKRRFRVRRDRPLAAAGLDRRIRPRTRVRLGGRHRAAHGGRLTYRWSLVRRPRGSRTIIRGRTRARPSLIPDLPGRYVARVRVAERRRGRAAASQTSATTSDDVSLFVSPPDSLVSVAANAYPVNERGIRLGNTIYHHPGPGSTIQWLVVDRSTLQPEDVGNTWCCTGRSLQRLTDSLSNLGLGQLVIITIPPSLDPTLAPHQADFTAALDTIGVDPVDLTETGQQRTIVGIPSAGKGSGWVWRRGHATGDLPTQGWLMPDGDLGSSGGGQSFRFQPLKLGFDTSSQSTATSNTMTFAGQAVTDSIPAGTSGFQVAEIDPRDFSIVKHQAFRNVTADLNAMAAMIGVAKQDANYVAVQSIGTGVAFSLDAWETVNEALVSMGANPHYFNISATNGRRYAFVGGPPLGRADVAQSNSTILVNPTPPRTVYQPGTVSGEARMRPNGYFPPDSGSSIASPETSLYDAVFTPPTPWPYTAAAGDPDAAAYERAMTYITAQLLESPQGDELAAFPGDVRLAYLGLPDYDGWGTQLANLKGIHYPGGGAGACNAAPVPDKPAFSLTEFCKLKAELISEFGWLIETKSLTDRLAAAFQLAGDADQGELRKTGDKIEDAIDPPNNDIVAAALYLIGSLGEYADIWEFGKKLYDDVFTNSFGANLAANIFETYVSVKTDLGTPTSQQVSTKVDDLAAETASDIADAGETLDSIRAAALSDYGRLQAFAKLARDGEAVPKETYVSRLTLAAGRYFSSELVPVPFDVTMLRILNLDGGDPPAPNPAGGSGCSIIFKGAPPSSWTPFRRKPDAWTSLVLADTGAFKSDFAPESIAAPMWKAPDQSGYGIEKTTFLWAHQDALGQCNT